MQDSFVRVCSNPVIQIKLTELRDKKTKFGRFCELTREISTFLIYEALANIPLKTGRVLTPTGEFAKAFYPAQKIALVPIMRAGMPPADAGRMLLSDVSIHHLGLRRNEKTLKPESYYENAPAPGKIPDHCIVVESMLATGGSGSYAIDRIKAWGVSQITFVGILAAPEGIKKVRTNHPTVPIFVAAIDRCLNDKGYILPGLGDAGDRQFGT
ncbi:MAG: uracil phosphoribosyltransferase [bacterium]|nr:uracil phosphoribosyltransferase [bacterium]